MYTIGVDLSTQPKKTGVCVIHWTDGAATVKLVETGWDNTMIVAKADALRGLDATAIGIDSPFGWPAAFREFLVAAHPHADQVPQLPPRTDAWRLRTTDRFVKALTGINPLAVAMDKIASVAVRCMYLQAQLGVADRTGQQRVYEVYPRASLKRWGMSIPKTTEERATLLITLAMNIGKMTIPGNHWNYLCCNDHAFDAFISALTVRAAFLGLTTGINDVLLGAPAVIKQEGWIHLPGPDALPKLN